MFSSLNDVIENIDIKNSLDENNLFLNDIKEYYIKNNYDLIDMDAKEIIFNENIIHVKKMDYLYDFNLFKIDGYNSVFINTIVRNWIQKDFKINNNDKRYHIKK